MKRSIGISDILGRLDATNAIFENLPLNVLDKPYLQKYISQTNVNNLKQCIYNQFFIFKATKISLFDLIKQSGKVEYQKGGNPYQMMFKVFVIIILLAAKTIASSNELILNSQKNGPAFEWSNILVERSVINVVEIPGAKNTPILFGLTYKNQLNSDLTKLFQETQRNVYSLLKPIRKKCLTHVKQNKMSVQTEYINLPNGLQEIDSSIENPTTYDKDTQSAACFEINPLPFNFNQDTGNIEFIHVNMPLNQVTEILYAIIGDMDSVIKDTTKPKPNKEFIEAYNGMLIIANGVEKIRELLFDIFSPVVFNPDMPNEYRLESLEDSFGSIINEMTQMKDLLNLKNPIQQMEANAKLDYANEEFQNEETVALAREMSRKAKKIKSEQNVKDTSEYYGNQFDENMAPVKSIGKKVLEVPVDFVGAVSDAAINTALAPVNSVLKGAKEMIMNNKFIMALLALGVFVTGVVTITIAKNKLTIVYKIGNAIKTIVLLPITVPIWIGKKVINVVWYRSTETSTNPTANVPLIDNGPVTSVVIPAVEPVVEPVVTSVNPVEKKTPKQKSEKLEIKKWETELNRVTKIYADYEQMGYMDKLPGIKRGIVQITEKLESLNKAKGTRKRNNNKNTKKNNNKKRSKPSRKLKSRK